MAAPRRGRRRSGAPSEKDKGGPVQNPDMSHAKVKGGAEGGQTDTKRSQTLAKVQKQTGVRPSPQKDDRAQDKAESKKQQNRAKHSVEVSQDQSPAKTEENNGDKPDKSAHKKQAEDRAQRRQRREQQKQEREEQQRRRVEQRRRMQEIIVEELQGRRDQEGRRHKGRGRYVAEQQQHMQELGELIVEVVGLPIMEELRESTLSIERGELFERLVRAVQEGEDDQKGEDQSRNEAIVQLMVEEMRYQDGREDLQVESVEETRQSKQNDRLRRLEAREQRRRLELLAQLFLERARQREAHRERASQRAGQRRLHEEEESVPQHSEEDRGAKRRRLNSDPPDQAASAAGTQADPIVVDEELLEDLLTCDCCDEEYDAEEFPVLSACTHEPDICSRCLEHSIEVQLNDMGWNDIRCPSEHCDVILQYEDVHRVADQATRMRYDNAALQSALVTLPDFRYCQRPDCGSGQIHENGTDEPIFRCVECGFRHCVVHNIPWHEGVTCQEYDKQVEEGGIRIAEQQRRQEEASLAWISSSTKKCPECGCNIQKNGGCDHMTRGRCKHEFCWICLAPYNPILVDGNHRHIRGCPHYF